MVYSEYAPVEENQDKKHEFYPMETTIFLHMSKSIFNNITMDRSIED